MARLLLLYFAAASAVRHCTGHLFALGMIDPHIAKFSAYRVCFGFDAIEADTGVCEPLIGKISGEQFSDMILHGGFPAGRRTSYSHCQAGRCSLNDLKTMDSSFFHDAGKRQRQQRYRPALAVIEKQNLVSPALDL